MIILEICRAIPGIRGGSRLHEVELTASTGGIAHIIIHRVVVKIETLTTAARLGLQVNAIRRSAISAGVVPEVIEKNIIKDIGGSAGAHRKIDILTHVSMPNYVVIKRCAGAGYVGYLV